jgi:hypothetical protein
MEYFRGICPLSLSSHLCLLPAIIVEGFHLKATPEESVRLRMREFVYSTTLTVSRLGSVDNRMINEYKE